MPSPSIDMIAELLKTCSLFKPNHPPRTPNAPPPPQPPPPPQFLPADSDPTDENSDITLDLNSDISLPFNWEQCLDVRTGEVYYIDWRTGTRTSEDPRNFNALNSSIFYSSGSSISSSSGDDEDDTQDTACSSSVITSLSSHSSSDATSAAEPIVLIAAGCKACFMYFMVPKWLHVCPKCGAAGLLHLAGDSFI
ncbi:putative WW domain superfamily protein [Dioscorea sansibarensis]